MASKKIFKSYLVLLKTVKPCVCIGRLCHLKLIDYIHVHVHSNQYQRIAKTVTLSIVLKNGCMNHRDI